MSAAAAFREALSTAPILNVASYGPVRFDLLTSQADFRAVARIEDAEVPPPRNFGSETLACESEEGVFTGEDCVVHSFSQTVAEAAPVGATIVLYGQHSEVGDFYQLAHPGAWAVVGEGGTLLSLGVHPEAPPGVGGIRQLEEVPGPVQ